MRYHVRTESGEATEYKVRYRGMHNMDEWISVSRVFPSWARSILTEIYLGHACSYHEIEDGNARAG
jgi:hypothetical protein|eukprot:SAG25_NODE_651_length_6170_cov_759.229451_4_plen_66_part_00